MAVFGAVTAVTGAVTAVIGSVIAVIGAVIAVIGDVTAVIGAVSSVIGTPSCDAADAALAVTAATAVTAVIAVRHRDVSRPPVRSREHITAREIPSTRLTSRTRIGTRLSLFLQRVPHVCPCRVCPCRTGRPVTCRPVRTAEVPYARCAPAAQPRSTRSPLNRPRSWRVAVRVSQQLGSHRPQPKCPKAEGPAAGHAACFDARIMPWRQPGDLLIKIPTASIAPQPRPRPRGREGGVAVSTIARPPRRRDLRAQRQRGASDKSRQGIGFSRPVSLG